MRTFPRREEGNKVRRPRQSRGRRRERSDRAHPPLSTRLASGRLSEPFNLTVKFKLNHLGAVSTLHCLPLSDMRGGEFDLRGESCGSNRVKRKLGDWISSIDGDGFLLKRGSSSVGRASAFQAEGRGFDPRFPLHYDKWYY